MSYQVLARKYRPKNFDTLVGQEHVVRALTHALQTGRLHHAYLFTGTRGVGKTTLSRILAKSLNCIGPDGAGGITAQPCGVCDACSAIDAGRFVDYIEMDAASNRGVDEMAQLLEQAVYAPSNARFKVYMIDEVHMLTNHAFNAMLKTLEEPPAHVKFILATTDPQKIPVTVLSRCLQFNLKQMPPGHIVSHLDNILGQENIAFEQGALRLLAQGAHGSMRDALSLTDQAIAYAAGQVTLDAVQAMLGALDQSYLVRLLDALAGSDGSDLLAVADDMASRSLSYSGALQDLGTLLHRIALAQSVPTAVPGDLPELSDIMRLAGVFDPQEVQLYYQIVVHGRNEMGLAPDEYAGFTMTLLRMLAFRPGHGGVDGVALAPGRPVATHPAGTPARAASATVAMPRPPVTPAPSAQSSQTVAPQAAPQPQRAASPQPVAQRQQEALPQAPNASAMLVAPPVALPPAAPAGAPPVNNQALSPARVALNAALEAARAASGGRGQARPPVPAPVPASPTPASAPAIEAVPGAMVPPAAPVAPRAALPWESSLPDIEPPSAVTITVSPSVAFASAPALASDTTEALDEPPSWVTEFSDERAVLQAPADAYAPPTLAVRTEARTEARPPRPYVITPVEALGWDGNWPALATVLPLRGVAQQLALQTELDVCTFDGNVVTLRLRVPINTLRASGNADKLAAALCEHFGRKVMVDIDVGPVWHTAGTEGQAAREACQMAAERAVDSDPLVQSMMRDLGAIVVPGSIRPAAPI